MEECSTHLTHICKHQHSGENPMKRQRSFQSTMWFSSAVEVKVTSTADKSHSLLLQLMKITVLAESSFIFSLGSLCYADAYRCESGTCCTLPFFLTWLIYRTWIRMNFKKIAPLTWEILQHCHEDETDANKGGKFELSANTKADENHFSEWKFCSPRLFTFI